MRRIFWRAYFFVALALMIAGLVMQTSTDVGQETAWWVWVQIPLYVVQIVGLFGFVYQRRLAVAKLWQFVFVFTVVFGVWDWYSLITDAEMSTAYDTTSMTGTVIAVIVTAGLLIEIPMVIGLFLYGFRCKALWRVAQPDNQSTRRATPYVACKVRTVKKL